MNYIHQLQCQVREANEHIVETLNRAKEFEAHLASPKFQGEDLAGNRNDWIAVADVRRWLNYILDTGIRDAPQNIVD